MSHFAISRRDALIGAGLAATAWPAAAQQSPIVETAQGKVQGITEDGVHIFRGLNYGANTTGRNRFMPARPAASWAGVRTTIDYGPTAPQRGGSAGVPAGAAVDEDCLRLNIWTRGLGDGGKRPVMVWFHGGGFESGSGSAPTYDGRKLCQRGDVVVVTINHRLGVFGHCSLGHIAGADFAQSGNVGFLDLVASLRWVRENIERFGGDPSSVTIFGQSGGGRKVSLCYASPAAQGLFHRGIVQSGAHLRIQTPDQAQKLTGMLLAKLGLAPGDARKLQDVPMRTLIETNTKVLDEANYRFSPVIDGITFKDHPYWPNVPAISSNLPMMMGTMRTELANQMGGDESLYALDEAGLAKRLTMFVPEADVAEAIRVFRASRPQANPGELFFTIASARGYVRDQTILAEQRTKARAPTYVYRVMWRSPIEGGRRVSPHSMDLPFIFDTVSRAPRWTGPETASTRVMSNAMSESWLAFAKTGNPNNRNVPAWKPYDLRSRNVMLFDDPPQAMNDPHKDERLFMAKFESQQLGRTLHRQDL